MITKFLYGSVRWGLSLVGIRASDRAITKFLYVFSVIGLIVDAYLFWYYYL